jgi:hypothetical protein
MLPYEDAYGGYFSFIGKLKVRLLTHTRAHMSTMQLLLPNLCHTLVVAHM